VAGDRRGKVKGVGIATERWRGPTSKGVGICRRERPMGELLRERTCGEGSPGRWGSKGPQGRESDHGTLASVAWTSVCAANPGLRGADTCLALRRLAGRGPEVWEVSRREKDQESNGLRSRGASGHEANGFTEGEKLRGG